MMMATMEEILSFGMDLVGIGVFTSIMKGTITAGAETMHVGAVGTIMEDIMVGGVGDIIAAVDVIVAADIIAIKRPFKFQFF